MIRQNRTYFAFYGNDCWGSTIVLTNSWYHFAFVYDYEALTQYIYLNGILECTHSSSSSFQATSGAITIGAINNTGTTPASFWTGYIDQMAYVSRAKTATEVLMDATLVAYYSFDGGSYYDSGPNKINGQDLFSSNGTSWCMPMLGLTSSDEIVGQSWNSFMMTVQGPVLQLGVWTHIVTSYSINNSVRLWINGTLIGSSATFTYAASSSPDWITVGTTFPAAMSCASGSVSTGQFYGMIDELRVYSRELTSSDVYALANP
ncbi:unnamed protein product [Rotaria sp. Silwood2]|nr:unnamed protein product [Rotaria sp. Silwood2]CAF4163091.1 unnamed protein product [Rotaria sp. Silwood2]